MSITVNSRTFAIDSVSGNNQVVYRDTNSTLVSPSVLRLSRTDPTPQGSFPGVGKTDSRFHRRAINGDSNWPAVMYVGTSVPANMIQAEKDALLADFRAYVASDAFADLFKNGTIYVA